MKAGVYTCNIVESMKKPLQKKSIDNCKCNPNKPFRPSISAFWWCLLCVDIILIYWAAIGF